MKKKLFKKIMLVMAMAVLCVLMAVTASAETYGNYEYTVLENGTVEISKYTGQEKDVVVPAEIDGKPVTVIGEMAFYFSEAVSVKLPEGIVSIEASAFESCHYLKTINIPATVTYIGEMPFAETHILEYIDVDDDNAFYCNDEAGALYNKDKTFLIQFPQRAKVENYEFPASLKEIGYMALQYNGTLMELNIPEGIEKINIEPGLYLPFNLRKITVPNTAKDFSFLVEQGMCLTSVVVSEDAKSIENICLLDCPSLKEIIFKGLDTEIKNLSFDSSLVLRDDESAKDFSDIFYDCIWVRELSIDEMLEDEKFQKAMSEYISEGESKASVYCHSGSTAEAYAIENGLTYELTHFFEGEWTYDYEQMIRWRKCIHCDELEIEPLEKTENDGTEIIAPENPELDFDVDNIESTGDDFILVEEDVKNALGEEWSLLKAFDITLKNKDGVHVQPDGTVKVKLPLDWEKEGNYKVYRVNDDGTLTDMNAYRQGSHMVFDTDHFSIYVIVEEKTEETPEYPGTSDESSSPEESGKNSFDFIKVMIEWFRNIIRQITDFFRSIGEYT